MCHSERSFFPTFPTFQPRLGTRQAPSGAGVPNLPNLPNLFPPVRMGARAGVCTQARVHTRAQVIRFTLGRLGRLGRVRRHKAFRAPNLCLTSVRLGT